MEQLGGTSVPILFVVGGEDALYPPDIVADVQKRIPGSRYVEVPGTYGKSRVRSIIEAPPDHASLFPLDEKKLK